jgi:hypothetical protein
LNKKRIYRIFFTSQGKAYELYARKLGQADLYGFVEIEELLFGERSSVVVDPSEESLRKEFGGVRRIYVPYHAIARIDEVEREGPGKVLSLAGGEGGGGTVVMPPGEPPKRD